MKIKTVVIGYGHRGELTFEVFPFAELFTDDRIQEANEIIEREVNRRVNEINFVPCGTVERLTMITWEVIE